MLESSSTSNLSLPFLLCCTSPSCGHLHSKCLVKNRILTLAFEEDDPDALAFKADDPDALAFEADDIKDGPLLDTISGELYTMLLELLSKEEGPFVLSKSVLLYELMTIISASKNKRCYNGICEIEIDKLES
ncbi:hypothetical protein Tco_1059624 [Tanacetum coccineum]